MNIILELKKGLILTKESCNFVYQNKQLLYYTALATIVFIMPLATLWFLFQGPKVNIVIVSIGYFFFYYFLPRGQTIVSSEIIHHRPTTNKSFVLAGLSTPKEIIKLILSYFTLVIGLSIVWLLIFSIIVLAIDSITVAHLMFFLKKPYLIICILFYWSTAFFQLILSLPIFPMIAIIIPTITFQLVWFYFAFLISAYEKSTFFDVLVSSIRMLVTNIVKYVSIIMLLMATSFLLVLINQTMPIVALAYVPTALFVTIVVAVFTTKIYWNQK